MKIRILLAMLSLLVLQANAQDTAQRAINEAFDDSALHNFHYGSTGVKDAFKWTAGASSSIEPASKVLLFKLDPADSAGAGRGPEIISNEFTHYGSYSARYKIPDVR